MAAMFIILMNVETDNSQLKRVQTVYNSMFAEDVRTTLMKSEGSGAVRIMPILNTFSIDLFDSQPWIGQGNDHILVQLDMSLFHHPFGTHHLD